MILQNEKFDIITGAKVHTLNSLKFLFILIETNYWWFRDWKTNSLLNLINYLPDIEKISKWKRSP